MKYHDMLVLRLRQAAQNEQVYGLGRQRRALDREALREDRLLRALDVAIVLLATLTCVFGLLTIVGV